MRLFSTEQISKYHPDKYADQISDAILTEHLKADPKSRVACETMVKDNTIVLGGEIRSKANIDCEKVARRVAKKLGYTVENVINLLGKQSQEIYDATMQEEKIGAGDQGIMFGYATNETESYLPYGFELANKIIKAIETDVENNPNTILRGDAKTQVTVDLDKPQNEKAVETVVVSVCHKPLIQIKEVKKYVEKLLINDGINLPAKKYLINPAGTWTVGGPTADCGLTGRKIVCDQYGGYCAVGGGAFSGKDPSKVDRSAAYMARVIAVDLVKKFKLKWCEVQLAYAIGVAEPVGVIIKSDRGVDYSNYVKETYDLTPYGMIQSLGLLSLNYEKIAEGCHYRKNVLEV